MTTATQEKPASDTSAMTVAQAMEKCKAAAVAIVKSGQPIGDDMPIPLEVIQLLPVASLTGRWFIGLCKTLARRKSNVDKLPPIDALGQEAAEKQAEAAKLEPAASERIRVARDEFNAAEVNYHNTVTALRKEAEEISRAAGRAYASDFDERFMGDSAPHPVPEGESALRDWTCVAMGKSGRDHSTESIMRGRDSSARPQSLEDALDPYSSY